jgi:hypothetical protein
MTGTATDFATLRFSTDDLPEPDRLAVLREVYGRIVRLDMEPMPGECHPRIKRI